MSCLSVGYKRDYSDKMRLKTAKLISTFSHPIVLFPASVPFFVVRTQFNEEKILVLFPVLFILAIPVVYFFYALRKKKISDWELTHREERYPIFALSLICGGASLLILWKVATSALFTLALIFYLAGILVTIINFYWKISVHTAGITAGAIAFNFLFQNPVYHYLYFVIPLVVWSRHEEKKHTAAQTIGGVVLGGVVALSVLGFGGWV